MSHSRVIEEVNIDVWKKFTIDDRPSLLIHFGDSTDYTFIRIPNLHYDGDSGSYGNFYRYLYSFGTKRENTLQIEIQYDDDDQYIYASLTVKSSTVSFGRQFQQPSAVPRLLEWLHDSLQREVERQDAMRKGRALAAMRHTLGDRRPLGNSPVPDELTVLHGPGNEIARAITGLPGSAHQQMLQLRERATRRGRALGVGARGGRRRSRRSHR